MRAGTLDQRIAIQTNTPVRASNGQLVESWTTTKTVWAEAITTGGGEFYAAQKKYAEARVVFRIREDSTITVLQRIFWDSRYWQILGIDPVNGQRRERLLTAKEVV